jgi:hypothetical protein
MYWRNLVLLANSAGIGVSGPLRFPSITVCLMFHRGGVESPRIVETKIRQCRAFVTKFDTEIDILQLFATESLLTSNDLSLRFHFKVRGSSFGIRVARGMVRSRS